METANPQAYKALRADLETDVCVIGSGIAGLSTAYQLTKAGKKVVVLESRHLSAGQTQRTTAHLSNAHDDYYSEVEKIHGEEGMRIAAQAHTAAIETIDSVSRSEGIDCDLVRLQGYLFAPPGDDPSILDTELEAATRAGIAGLHIIEAAPIPGYRTGRCLVYPQQGRFHPLKYLMKLAELITARGGAIYTGTPVKSVEGGERVKVVTHDGPVVTAGAVVVATNSPVNDVLAMHTKMAPYVTYAIGGRLPKGALPEGLYWDTLDPYHYVRLQETEDPNFQCVIVGGEDHKAGQASDLEERHGRLEDWAREHFPSMGEVVYRWSGMYMETTDGNAFIGPDPGGQKNVYIATGDSGMGMTHGTAASLLLKDLILGNDHPWRKLYDPARKPVSGMAGQRFVSENANVLKEYFVDWLGGGDIASPDELQPDQGGIVRRGVEKVAVYRDVHGDFHQCSAVCPHLGCIVHWNNLEKVWDCPCHGSRFDAYGRVIKGPAVDPLASLDRTDRS